MCHVAVHLWTEFYDTRFKCYPTFGTHILVMPNVVTGKQNNGITL